MTTRVTVDITEYTFKETLIQATDDLINCCGFKPSFVMSLIFTPLLKTDSLVSNTQIGFCFDNCPIDIERFVKYNVDMLAHYGIISLLVDVINDNNVEIDYEYNPKTKLFTRTERITRDY